MNLKMLPPTESEFNRQIYILALVCHIKEHASRPPPQCNSVEQKHLRLLDYIAPLLVTKSRGDVAAVTMEHTATSFNFYFAKNRPCDFPTLSFVEKILKVLKEQSLRAMHKSVFMIVMVECAEKVSARIRKSQKAIEEVGGNQWSAGLAKYRPWQDIGVVGRPKQLADHIEFFNWAQDI